MNYSEMTDFEINKAVGEIVFDGKWACKPGAAGNPTGSWYYGSRDSFVDPLPFLPDYCNSWADAGPIIQENRITIMASQMKSELQWVSTNGMGQYQYHGNPLRAAMEVFLQIQEKANA